MILGMFGCGGDGGGPAARSPLAGCVQTMTVVHGPRSPRDRWVETWDEHGRRARTELHYDPDGPFAQRSQDIGYHNTYRRDGTLARVIKMYSLLEGSPDLVETMTFDHRGNPIERFRDLNGDDRLGPGDQEWHTENHYKPDGHLRESVETLSARGTDHGRVEYANARGRDRTRGDLAPSPQRTTNTYDEWGNLVLSRSETWPEVGRVWPPAGVGPYVVVERRFNTYRAPGVLAEVQASSGRPDVLLPPAKRRTTFYDECGRPSHFLHDPEGDGVLGEWDVTARFTYDCPCDPKAG